jgi:crossover junction endodeoxyribonuclease RuvC
LIQLILAEIKVTGLDLSYTSTGVAVVQAGVVSVHRLRPPAKLDGHDRLRWLRFAICDLARGSTHIAVEGAAFNAKFGVLKAGVLTGIVQHCLWMENPDADVVIPSPVNVKQFAIGKGVAEKDEMVATLAVRYQHVARIIGNDTADALALADMWCHQLGIPLADVPRENQKAAFKAWPYKRFREL